MSLDQRVQQLETELRALKLAQRDFLTTRIEERDVRIEGTLNIKGVRIMSGGGVPTVAVPNGSIFFRTNGSASNTLYVREGGAWRRVTTA